jgi:hypothetical protein
MKAVGKDGIILGFVGAIIKVIVALNIKYY